MNTKVCPVCGQASAWLTFAFFEGVPRTGVFLEHPDASMPCHDLRFTYCPCCALVRRCPDNYSPPDYRAVNRRSANQLPGYTQELAQEARERVDSNALVIDVGGNDGTFGRLLAERGFNHVLNVEPSESLAAYSQAHGCPSVCEPLTRASATGIRATRGPAAVVFARHVVEHVAAPMEFVESIKTLMAEDGWLCLETPDVSTLLDGYAHELWEEHLYYFSPHTLSVLLRHAGLQVRSLTRHPHRGSHNMVLWAQHTASPLTNVHLAAEPQELERCANFMTRWTTWCAGLPRRGTLPTPVYALGASHPQLNFLHFSGLADLTDLLIDDDPEKAGHHVRLPQAVPVLTSQQAAQRFAGGGTLLLTAWGCDGWTRTMESLAQKEGLVSLHPYTLNAFSRFS